MNPAELHRCEERMVAWAREAGALARELAAGPGTLRFKAGREAVTEADGRIETLLRARIAAAYPDHAVVGEEQGGADAAAGASRIWHLDPVDGTLNYALGLPDYCVSLALADGEGAPLAACVHQPATGDVWTAVRGGGARRNGQPARVSTRDRLGDAVISAQVRKRGRYGRHPRLLQALLLSAYKLRKVGAVALELAWVGAGAFDGMVIASAGPIPFHDVAAGLLLITEAGGRVSDAAGRPYRPGGPELVAGNPGVHRDLLALGARDEADEAGC